MPKVEQPRSPLTGELLSEDTLELAANEHGIALAETSVGRMFDMGAEKLAAKKRQASLQREARSITIKYKGEEIKATQGMNSDEWNFKHNGQKLGVIIGEDEKGGNVVDEDGNDAGTARLVEPSNTAYAEKRRAKASTEKKALYEGTWPFKDLHTGNRVMVNKDKYGFDKGSIIGIEHSSEEYKVQPDQGGDFVYVDMEDVQTVLD